jgi:hypothetical protein
MGNRERLPALVLGAIVLVLGMGWTTAASADQIIPNPTFSDARSDFPTRTGTLVEARYGPFTVNANSQVHNAIDFSAPAPCTNCYITDIVPNLIYDGDANNTTGTTANLNNGAMMHHFVLINNGKTDTVCPSGLQGQIGERFFASGNERTHMHLPSPFGYYNQAGQNTWVLIYHLVNKAAVQKKLSIQIFYRYRTDPPNASEAKPLWLDIDGCGDSEYTTPVGYADTTTNWTSTVGGRMVAISGHLHDVDITGANPCDTHCPAEGGGIATTAELVGGPNNYYGPVPPNNPPPASITGTTLCRSEGSYGTPFAGTQWKGHLDTMSGCEIQTDVPAGHQPEPYPAGGAYPIAGIPFKAGDVIKLHTEYQNGTGTPQTDVMGIMMAWYSPTAGGYARPKGASPMRLSLVPAYNACSSPNSTHGAPLSSGSCNPPVQSSGFLTLGSPDANSAGANGTASMTMTAVAGNSATTADEADLKLKMSATDVRKKSDLTDYTGQLKAATGLRIIDRDNGPAEVGVGDTTYSFTVPCAATGSTTVGSTCSLNTTADALVANTIKEGTRAIWQLGKVDVLDGGADGVASTDPNTRYLTQGYFVP